MMKKILFMLMAVVMLFSGAIVNAAENDIELNSSTPDFELKNLGYIYSRDYLTNDEMYSIQVKAINNTSSKMKCNVYAAVYGADGSPKVIAVQEQVIFHDSSNNVTFNIPSNFNDGGKGKEVRVFMWETDTLRPLTDVLEVSSDEI